MIPMHCPLCTRPLTMCACGTTPAQDAPKAAPQTRRRMGVDECTVCGLAVQFCRGHAAPEAGSKDGSESNLIARIRAAKGGR